MKRKLGQQSKCRHINNFFFIKAKKEKEFNVEKNLVSFLILF